MNRIRIYVEGVNDQVFIQNYLETVLGFTKEEAILCRENIRVQLYVLKGWDKLKTTKIIEDFRDNVDQGIKSLVIVDADKADNDGTFAVRAGQIDAIKSEHNIDFNYFLIPNHQDDGYLETVLRVILKEEYKALLDCLDGRDSCLQEADRNIARTLKIPPSKGGEKSKIAQLRKFLDASSDYKDNSIWNLNHDYLSPLKNFLEEQLG